MTDWYVKGKLIVVEGEQPGGEVCKGKGKKWGQVVRGRRQTKQCTVQPGYCHVSRDLGHHQVSLVFLGDQLHQTARCWPLFAAEPLMKQPVGREGARFDIYRSPLERICTALYSILCIALSVCPLQRGWYSLQCVLHHSFMWGSFICLHHR